ncbi:MAG: hypothetical protein MUQ26_08535, partial [Armatimonadetes bacterium]|nr:hypothetical protein [Armatimonadota bacterium]
MSTCRVCATAFEEREVRAVRDMRVAAVQFEHTAGDKVANLGKIRGFVERAAREKVELIVFPECCIT